MNHRQLWPSHLQRAIEATRPHPLFRLDSITLQQPLHPLFQFPKSLLSCIFIRQVLKSLKLQVPAGPSSRPRGPVCTNAIASSSSAYGSLYLVPTTFIASHHQSCRPVRTYVSALLPLQYQSHLCIDWDSEFCFSEWRTSNDGSAVPATSLASTFPILTQ
jgi:hypothetical protein